MSKIRKESYRVGTYAIDLNGKMKVSTIFNYMQEVAINHAQSQNYGVKEMAEKGVFWVLSRAYIDILEYPTLGDTVTIETWAKGTDKIFVLRDFKIYNSSNKNIANVTTNWVIVDCQKMRLQRPKILNDELKYIDNHAINHIPGKIIEIDNKEFIFNKDISYCDIDLNKHVNNVRYVEMVLDSFSQDYYKDKQPEILHINFLSQCKYGDTIQIYKGYNQDKDMFYVEGIKQNTTQKCFQALIKWI
ncbi:MAG: thioesterase [Vallitalea sp.]|jgi:acyl-ACP thioesterase|nr:thioesterase [Vallitalea sp.]